MSANFTQWLFVSLACKHFGCVARICPNIQNSEQNGAIERRKNQRAENNEYADRWAKHRAVQARKSDELDADIKTSDQYAN